MKFATLVGSWLLLTVMYVPVALAESVDEFGDPIAAGPTVDLTQYPIVNSGDWRSPKADIDWSTPVLVRDEFDGDYLAVFDKNYQKDFFTDAETGIISNWSRNYLRVYSYASVQVCGGFFCRQKREYRETQSLAIKVGKAVFKLEGKDGNFAISDELAYALKTSPPGEAKIKVKFEGEGAAIKSAIGKFTVSAWKTVYQDAQPPGAATVSEAPPSQD